MAGNQRRFFDPPTEEERKFWGETASDVMAVPSKAASLLQPGWSMLADALTDFLPGQKAQAQAQPLPRPQVKPQTIESPAATSPAAQPQALAAAITERPPAPPPRVRSEAVASRRLPPGEHWQDTPFPEGRHWTSADTQPGRLPQISSLPDPEGTGSSTFMPATPQFGPGASAQNMFRKAVEDAAPGVYAQKNQGATEAELLPGKTTYAKLWGGDQVSSAETEMDTARKELGSFGDSAGKWWSVLLAAMFPQYGNALNMMEGFKRNKYLAARDKYNTAMEAAMKEHNQKPMNISGMPGWMMINGQAVKVASDPSRKETRYTWSDPSKLPTAVQVPEGGDPNVLDPGWSDIGPPKEVTSYDPQTMRALLDMQGKNSRLDEQADYAAKAAQAKYAHQERMKNLDRDTRLLTGALAKAGYSWVTSTDIASINKQIADDPDNIGMSEPQLRRIRERKIQELVEAKRANAVMPVSQAPGPTAAPAAAQQAGTNRPPYKPNFRK